MYSIEQTTIFFLLAIILFGWGCYVWGRKDDPDYFVWISPVLLISIGFLFLGFGFAAVVDVKKVIENKPPQTVNTTVTSTTIVTRN